MNDAQKNAIREADSYLRCAGLLTYSEVAGKLLALRPQAVPIGFVNKPVVWEPHQSEMVVKITCKAQPTYGFTHAVYTGPLRPQAVPMTDEPFLKVHKGEICYKSDADDQSYGMWCSVNWDTEHGLSDGTVFYVRHGITAQAKKDGA